ncbi:MAG: hypothetical protein ACHQSE_13885, partial [Gemmatimonadales bacterium]
FRAAADSAESRAIAGAQPGGLTLADLHAIAREIGIPPDAVARAARALDHAPVSAATRRVLGLPIGVQRTVQLDRALTDGEWDQLVVVLRQTFGATGVVTRAGSLREWRNGNLHVLLEPTPSGQQVRMRTINGAAQALTFIGGAMLGLSAFVGVMSTLKGTLDHGIVGVGALAVLGIGFITAGVLRVPAWAVLRGAQMDEIADRLREGGEGGEGG